MKKALEDGSKTLRPLPMSIEIVVRPWKSRLCFSAEIPLRVFEQSETHGEQIVLQQVRDFLLKAEKSFAKKDMVIEITTRKGEKVISTRHEYSQKVAEVMKSAPQQAKKTRPENREQPTKGIKPKAPEQSKPQPVKELKREAKPPKPKPKVKQQKTVRNPKINAQDIEALDSTHDPSEPIDYESMKYFPTDAAHRYIRKTFKALGVKTGEDILKLLGTNEPTRMDWEIFIRELKKTAKAIGTGFGPSADGTLYWWLTKVKKWVRPFPKTGTL